MGARIMNDAQAEISFPSRLAGIAERRPDEVAITFGRQILTWKELDRESNRIAHAMINYGVRAGDLITLALPNGLSFFTLSWGIWKCGATPQPVSTMLTSSELKKIVDVAKSRLVITEDNFLSLDNSVSLTKLLTEAEDSSPLPDRISPSWKAPTSGGSTGLPKVIKSTIPAIYSIEVEQFFRLHESDTCLIPAPIYHNAAFVLSTRALLAGSHLIVMPKFDSEEVLRLVEDCKVSFLYVVPTMMNRIAKLPHFTERNDMSSLRTVWHMAEPCPIWLKECWIEWLGAEKIWEIYAATEGVASTRIGGLEWLDHKGSVGKVNSNQQIRAFSTEGAMLGSMEIGELFLHPGHKTPVPYEYIGATPRQVNGWHSVGDIGYVDADDYLYLCDRRADMIIVGGVNIYPAEIEAAILAHPNVSSCAVIGLPCEDRGKRIHAIIQSEASETEIKAHLQDRLARHKTPHTIEFVNHSLRDDAGKVRRASLIKERTDANAE